MAMCRQVIDSAGHRRKMTRKETKMISIHVTRAALSCAPAGNRAEDSPSRFRDTEGPKSRRSKSQENGFERTG
jgi:hypothetical protein